MQGEVAILFGPDVGSQINFDGPQSCRDSGPQRIDEEHSAQKIIFTANCAMRGSATWPARNVPNAEFPFNLSKALIWSVLLTAPVLIVSGAKFG